ncbi:MAG: RimK family alpha-L-glutamate ligase [Pseudomonadota bacterium]
MDKPRFLALGSRLKNSPIVTTLGFRPNFDDYSDQEKHLLSAAEKIYFPTAFYADLFIAAGKKIFPSCRTYTYAQDKIRQSALFKFLGIPHPETRFFFGPRQKRKILDYFPFPFIAKQARGSSMGKGVFLVRNHQDLTEYLTLNGPAYIQEYIPIDRDIRVIVIGYEIVLAFWRERPPGDFRTNISRGGTIRLNDIPKGALDLALTTATRCGWDDVGLDILEHNGSFSIIEANMKYGRKGFTEAGIQYTALLEQMMLSGKI